MKSLILQFGTIAPALAALMLCGCSEMSAPQAQIMEVNEDAATITAHTGEERVTYDVAPEANITLDDQPAELSQLSAGDRMKVELEERGGMSVATRVEASSQESIPMEESADPVPY